jgi:hypothetical protein
MVAQPLIDGLTADANRFRGFDLSLVQAQDQEHRADPKRFLGGRPRPRKSFFSMRPSITDSVQNVRYYVGRSV